MRNNWLRGSIPALVTPLMEDGSLDENSFCSLIVRALSSGCQGVMILGSCGEGATVDRKTFEHAVAAAREVCEGRGLLIVSTGAISVDRVLKGACGCPLRRLVYRPWHRGKPGACEGGM